MKPLYKLLTILTFTKLIFIIILLASHYLLQTHYLSFLTNWDTDLFSKIATYGYNEPKLFVFMPIWPLIGHLFYKIGIPVWVGLLITANTISYLAVTCVYKFASNLWGQKTAWQATLLFIWAPTGWILCLPYSDGLFILLLTLSLWTATLKKNSLSGVLIALSSLVKVTGIMAYISLAIIQLQSHNKINKIITTLLTAVSGLLIWSLYSYQSTGHFYSYISQQSIEWDHTFIPYPGYISLTLWYLISLFQAQYHAAHFFPLFTYYLPEITDMFIGIFVIAITITQRHKLPPHLRWFVFIYLLLVTSTPPLHLIDFPYKTPPQLSITRYIWTCWLIFIPLAIWTNKHFNKLLYTSITLYILYAIYVINGFYVP